MDQYRILYFFFLLFALLLSIFCNKSDKSLYIFPFLLSAAFLAELIRLILIELNLYYNIIYHIYLPIEYGLLTFYFYLNLTTRKIKMLLLFSIPIFIFFSIFFTFNIVNIQKLPNFQIIIEEIFLIIWSTITILNIRIKTDLNIVQLPVFWISTASLIYFTGTFSFYGIYNYICESRPILTQTLGFYILKILNYLFYALLSIAFICSHRIRKYS